MSKFYAHFQDFVDAYEGPFDSAEACKEHATKSEANCNAKYMGAVAEADLPANAYISFPLDIDACRAMLSEMDGDTPPEYPWFGYETDAELEEAIRESARAEGLKLTTPGIKRTLEIMYFG